ncbi:MAG TPA: signal peptidase I [Acidimicrobiales bacterium]|nr:signal peptidase I [Acidimicrobiales bacterium]
MTDLDDVSPQAPTRGGGRPRRAVRSAIEWLVIIAAALAVAFLVKTFLVQAFYIPSLSMDPTLRIRDRVLVNKLSYRLHDVNRGDIVVFERPDCDEGDPGIKDLIKRVVALGGERVEGRDGAVFVDGRRLAEDYLPAGMTTGDFGPVEVPEGHIWVMGDNRGNSKDSRILCNSRPTPISEDDVIGRAFVRVWPLGDLTIL